MPVAYFWQDILVALVYALLDRVWRRSWAGWPLYVVLVAYTALNVPVTLVTSSPLTWPMLRAARGPLWDSLVYHCSPANILLLILIVGSSAVLPAAFRFLTRRHVQFGGLIFGLIAAVGPLALSRVDTLGLHRNAVVELLKPLAALPSSAGPYPDFSISRHWRVSAFASPSTVEDLSRYRGMARSRNVILVSLESVAAQYLPAYGGRSDLMPNFSEMACHGILFENAYAAYPESIKGLFSVLCSTFPAFDTTAEEHAKAACRSLPSVLGEAGYRTALFHSGRFMYLGMDSVVHGRGYDTLEDAGDIGGDQQSSFGVDEPSTVRRILSWIDTLPAGRPFFVTYLPVAGHHPYETPERGRFPENEEFGRYCNALGYGDAALGQLLDGVRARGLEEKTLWVVFGDHGEAFGQHAGNFGHTFFLYEENVRVPFLIFAPGLFENPVRVGRTASLVDAAPTVLDLLGLERPASYQGRSMLESESTMALFFTDYSLGLLGLRDQQWKFIYEIDSGRVKLWDLHVDPGEKNDLSAAYPDRVAWYRHHLVAWSEAQKSYIVNSPSEVRSGIRNAEWNSEFGMRNKE